LKAQFISDKEDYFKSDVFDKILKFVQTNNKKCRLREMGSKLTLTIEGITTVDQAITILAPLSNQ
jgi:transcription-repair coupling factor (superfamily II helicase)